MILSDRSHSLAHTQESQSLIDGLAAAPLRASASSAVDSLHPDRTTAEDAKVRRGNPISRQEPETQENTRHRINRRDTQRGIPSAGRNPNSREHQAQNQPLCSRLPGLTMVAQTGRLRLIVVERGSVLCGLLHVSHVAS